MTSSTYPNVRWGFVSNRPGNSDEDPVCGYCDGTKLAYELRSDRGVVGRCIPCLAIERGQQQLRKPFDEFVNNETYKESIVFEDREAWDDHRRISYESARDWFTVLARLNDDQPLVIREPDAPGAINEHTRTFLQNIMGKDAHYPPSEVAGSELTVGQTTLGDIGNGD